VKPKDSRNSGDASSHAPPSLAARGFTRRRKKLLKQGGSGSTSSLLSSYSGGESHRHLQKPKNTQGSWFLSDSRICLFPFWICFVLGFTFFSASLFFTGYSSGCRFSVGNVAAYVGAAGGRRTGVGRVLQVWLAV